MSETFRRVDQYERTRDICYRLWGSDWIYTHGAHQFFRPTGMKTKSYWVGWYAPPDELYTLSWPCWETGETIGALPRLTLCAAVKARTVAEAESIIIESYDAPYLDAARFIIWCFCEERPDNWSPFCERFPRADWMDWPE